jgi:hypothetical protein
MCISRNKNHDCHMLHDATFIDIQEKALRTNETPVAVACGEDDNDNSSVLALADVLPHRRLITVQSNHMSAVSKPELGTALRDFLVSY